LHGTLLSLLAGLYCHAILAALGPLIVPSLSMLFYLCMAQCVFSRLWIYLQWHRPPISLWGRLWTLRWIIPGFDTVLVAPLMASLAAIAVPVALRFAGVELEYSIPVSLSLVLWITLNTRPTLEEWVLTGNHRIVPALTPRQEYVQL
jgi:hypothetical protein